jgi:signal transduction histidine kinase/CheY-like chemotaxis protein
MNNQKRIVSLTIVVAIVFLITVFIDIFINKKDEEILNIQLEAVKNYNLRKDRYIELNNAYREIFIDYKSLDKTISSLEKNINILKLKYPNIDNIKEATKIIAEQNLYIDSIKKYNTKVFNSLKKTREVSLQFFSHIDISDKNNLEVLYLSRKIIDAFANIRSNRKSTFKKVRENISLIDKIIVTNKKLGEFKHQMTLYSLDVLSNTIKLRDNLKLFNKLEVSLDKKYYEVISSFEKNINKTIIIVLFIIFVYLIYKLLSIKSKIGKELDSLVKKQDQRIKEAIKDSELQKEKALEAAKSKSEFLANMSHEIRTPLNGILGFVDILKDVSKDKESHKYLQIIDSSSNHLLGVINDILDYSKIESGKLELDHIDFDVKKEFSITIDLFKAKASEKHIYLDVKFDENLPKVLNGDPLRLKQIISNFLSNAIKFTKNDEDIIVYISYENDMLRVSVKDKGIGISDDKLNLIFEAFSQEDSTTTRKFGGTGLGLSISKELVHLMNGDISVQSKLGEGSEFSFKIPAKIGKDIKEIEVIDNEVTFKGKNLLLVEDNESNIMFMKVILKKLEFDFDIAYDGLEAIEAFKNKKYDFILMDENMPNMGGIKAMQKIREIENQTNQKPTIIIALTANALKGDRERFLEAGMDEYLTKPLKRKKLEEILNLFV